MKLSLALLSALAATALAVPTPGHADILQRDDETFYLTVDTDSEPPDVSALYSVDNAVAVPDIKFTDDHAKALENLLSGLFAIPDNVVADGDEAVNTWLIDNGYRAKGAKIPPNYVARDEPNILVRSFWSVTKCVASILAVIGSTLIPVAKIARIKKLIGELGGVKKAVELMLKASTNEERLKIGGQALVLLAGEILGISAIKSNCT